MYIYIYVHVRFSLQKKCNTVPMAKFLLLQQQELRIHQKKSTASGP